MMEFLIGNVFSTPVGQRIQRATSGALQAEDWSLNLEICDIINETEDGCKDAAKALKKRIVGNRNFREVMLALTVLEACVKNCGQRFHACVCSREFVEDVLVTAILPKNNPPSILQDRILSLIQAWADAFRNNPPLSGVVRVYEDLKCRGMEFPMTDLDSLSPIHTPSRSVPENGTSPSPVSSSAHTPSAPAATHTPQSSPGAVSPEQMQKMKSELDVVRGNLSVMSEMLNHVTPGETSASDTELLQQLYSVCKQMQQRIVELVPCVSDEEMIRELLIINDDLNNSFIRYERFDRLNVRSHTEQQVTQKNLQPAGNLIDLRPVPLPANQNTQSQPRPPPCVPAEEEFDMFAQTRSSSLADQRKSVRYEEPGAVEGLAEALDTRLHVTAGSQHSSALEDVEKWLNLDKPDCNDEAGVTSEEFDRFLSERARAAEQHQSVGEGPVRARRGSGEHQHLFSL